MCPTMNCCSQKVYNIHNTDDRLFQLMHHSIGYSSQHNPVIVNYKRRKLNDWEKDIKDGEKRWKRDNPLVPPKNEGEEDEEEDEYKKLMESKSKGKSGADKYSYKLKFEKKQHNKVKKIRTPTSPLTPRKKAPTPGTHQAAPDELQGARKGDFQPSEQVALRFGEEL